MKPLKQETYQMRIIKDLGRVYPKEGSKQLKRMALFECTECLNEIRVQVKDAEKQSMCRSCKSKTTNLKHGDRQTRLYAIWCAMKTRATNKNIKNAKRYSKRGINICTEWKDSYIVFKEWALTNGYSKELSIDRKNNDGDYKPSNCRWVTREVQMANTRVDRINNTSGYRGVYLRADKNKWRVKLTHNGINHYIADWLNTAKEGAIAYNEYVKKNNLPHTLNTL